MSANQRVKKPFATLADDLKKIRNSRKPTPAQIEELNTLIEGPSKDKKKNPKVARPKDVEA
jgi:hypothetical protein